MLKQLFISSFLILAGANAFAQQKEYSCSHLKSKSVSAKTPTLTTAQLSETEKYDVSFYKLDLEMSNISTYLKGSGTIKGKALVTTDSVLFELFKTFTVDSIYFNGANSTFSKNESVLKVPANLNPGEEFEITVFYYGTPPTATSNPLGGSGMTTDSSPSWGNQVTWSLSEPFSAYEWFPAKQVLKDKADSCAVNITVDNSLKAGSNGILDSITDNGNGTSTYHWYHRHPVAYYLISVAVAEYVEYNVYAFQGTPDEIFIQNYIYNNPGTLTQFQTEIENTADFIELFSDLYGMYPFANEKYGHCMAPISGGMEHQTMTTQGFFEKSLTAHELAHQWWGDYVTCETWANIWINEGFASYSEYLMLQNLFPSQAAGDMQQRHTNIMSQAGGSVWVADSTDESAIFDSRLVYNKGAAIVHTLRFIINNDSLFFSGLRTFLDTYKNQTATALDFKEVMESVTGISLNDFFDQWYFGEGYPTYTVNWNNSGNNLHLNIKHFTSKNTTPLFTNPVVVKVARTGEADTLIRVPIASNNENIFIQGLANVTNIVQLDPDNWIINKINYIKKDTALILSASEITDAADLLKIYPVPASDYVTIEGGNDNYTLEIIDIRGTLVESVTFTNSYQLPVRQYPNGSYIFKITNNKNQSAIHRFIKL